MASKGPTQVKMLILRVNYIFPRLKSLQGLKSQKKEGRDEERKHTVIRLHTQSSTTRMHRGGLSSSRRCHPPSGPQTTREAGLDSQAVFVQRGPGSRSGRQPS